MSWAGYVTCKGERRGAYRVLMGKFDEKIPLGRRRPRWENFIKLGLKIIVWDVMDRAGQAQDRVKY